MKKLLIALCAILLAVPLTSASASEADKTIKAYEYPLPAGYTIKSIDTDALGNVYYAALIDENHAKLVAVSPKGETKWTVNTPAGKDLYVMVDYKNHVYASTGSSLISYEPNGSVNWSKDLGTSSFTATPGKDAVVLTTEGRTWAYDENGKTLYDVDYSKEGKVATPDFGYGVWTKTLQANSKYTIDVYEGAKKLFTVDNEQPIGLAVTSPDGETVYMRDTVKKPSQSGSLYAFNLDGSIKWTYTIGKMQRIDDMQVLDNGTIVFSYRGQNKISAVSSEGKLLWTKEKKDKAPLGTIKDIVYFGGDVYDKNGNQVATVSDPSGSGYIIAGDGSILLTQNDKFTRMVFKYSDVFGSWAYQPVSRLIDAGIISGYPDGSFKPNGEITKEEFIKLLMSAKPQSKETEVSGFFSDVPNSRWSYGVITNAVATGVIDVTEEGALFHPSDAITREQMVVYTARLLRLTPVATNKTFNDASDITFHPNLVLAAASKGLISGYPDETFRPKANLTRAEAAVMITRVLDYKN